MQPDSEFFEYLRGSDAEGRRGRPAARTSRARPPAPQTEPELLLGLGLVLAIEGLALALAPSRMEELALRGPVAHRRWMLGLRHGAARALVWLRGRLV